MSILQGDDEWADEHGYVLYRHNCGCGRTFYSDSGPQCPYCPPEEIDAEEDE